ncbi:hypothetical protein AAG906_011209 [Vitis piasezkii]
MEEEERHSDLFLEFAFRNDGLKKKKGNDSQSGGAVFLSSIHPKKKTLECNSNRIISPYFQKAAKEGEDRDSEAPLESESRGISPYFQKKRRMVSDSIACSGSDSNSQRLISPYFQKAVKQEERYSEEHCNFPNETDNKKKKKKKRKRKGNDTFESLKEERKINVQNVKMDDQKMGVELPVFNSNSSSERKVSPFCQKAVKEEEEMNLEAQVDSKPTVVSPYFEKKKRAVSDSVANSSSDSNSQRAVKEEEEGNSEEETKKGHENEESFKEEGKRKTNAQNVTMEDEKMKLPKKKSRAPPIRVVSPYFPINEEDAKKPVRAMFFNKLKVAYRRKSPDNNWKPPPSHFHLLQEDHYHDPWRVMVICMLLNCTSGLQWAVEPRSHVVGFIMIELPVGILLCLKPEAQVGTAIDLCFAQSKAHKDRIAFFCIHAVKYSYWVNIRGFRVGERGGEGEEELAFEMGHRVNEVPTSYLRLLLGAPFKLAVVWVGVAEQYYKRNLNAWELDNVEKLFARLQGKIVNGKEEDMVVWIDSRNEIFLVKSLYAALEWGVELLFQQESFGLLCVSSKARFFAWEAY